MAGSGREARRRRILEGGQDRLALITGRKPNLSPEREITDNDLLKSSLPYDANQPSVSRNEEDKSSFVSSADHPATKFRQDDGLVDFSKGPPVIRKPELQHEHLRAAKEDSSRREPPSAAQKAGFSASEAVLRVAQQIPISNVTSQEVSAAVSATEHDRMLCSLTLAILVVLSSAGFPVVGSRIFRWIISFRPLFLVLITNITLIIRRLLPDNQKNLVRGEKDTNVSPLGDGYAWAEEAGRALELGLMVQNVTGALFVDCSVYATIVVFGFSLFG